MFKGCDCSFFSIILIGIFMFLFIIGAVFISPIIIYFVFANPKVFGDYGSLLSGIGSIVGCFFSFFSICLVLFTIRQQSEEINKASDRFVSERRQGELIELQRMLLNSIENLKIKKNTINMHCKMTTQSYERNDCFAFFNKEITTLKKHIINNEYKEFSIKELEGDIESTCEDYSYRIESSQCIEETETQIKNWNAIIKEENDKYSLAYYKIDKCDYERFKRLKDEDIQNELIIICEKKHRSSFSIYIRSLLAICTILEKTKKENNESIFNESRLMIVSQFSTEEEAYVRLISQKYSKLNILLKKQ